MTTPTPFALTLFRIIDRSGPVAMSAADLSRAKSGPASQPIVEQRIADALSRLIESGDVVEVLPGRYVTARFNNLAA